MDAKGIEPNSFGLAEEEPFSFLLIRLFNRRVALLNKQNLTEAGKPFCSVRIIKIAKRVLYHNVRTKHTPLWPVTFPALSQRRV